MRRIDIETEGNVIQVTVKAKFVAGKPFLMKVENKKFIKDSRKGLLAEATFDLCIKHAGSSEVKFYFIILMCSTTLQKRTLITVSW